MKDSKCYLNEMMKIKRNLEKASEEKINYEFLYNQMKQLLNRLPDAKADLINAEKFFQDGGFIDGDGTFDKGMLKECYLKLASTIGNIDEVIEKINNKIFLLNQDINNYDRAYNFAYENYKKMLINSTGVK